MDIEIFADNNNKNSNVIDPDLCIPITRILHTDEFPAVRFLGIYIDPNLTFKTHIATMCTKISKSLYALRMAKNFLSQKALKTLYYSLIHCHLIYGIQIWSSTCPSFLNDLTKLQKYAIRIITHSKFNAHTEPLFKKTRILPLHDLVLFFKLQFMQQFTQGFLPEIFNDTWVINAIRNEGKRHVILRNDSDFYIPTARIALTERHLLSSFPKIWDEFPDENIKIMRNKLEFNAALKTHLIDKLSHNINCARLFCPSCSGPQ
jgi:hypothetical protein